MSGISMLKVGVGSCEEKPPIWNSENGQCVHVFHCASAAEIFIGWSAVTRIAKWLPTQRFTDATGTRTISDNFAARLNVSGLRPRASCQQQTPKTRAAPAVSPARIVCPNAQSAQSLETS